MAAHPPGMVTVPGRPGAHRTALLGAVVVTVLWSSSWVIIRIGLDEEGLRPITFAGMRYGSAALLLLLVALSRPAIRRDLFQLGRSDLVSLTTLGVVLYAVTQGAQFVALDHQPAATTSLVLATTPLVVAVISGRTLGERTTPSQVAGACLVLGGAAAYFSGSLAATAVGMTAALVGLGSNVAAAVMGRGINRMRTTRPLVVTAVSMSVGASLLLLVGLITEGVPAPTGRGLVLIAWLAVVNTALAFTLWNHSLRLLTATESALINTTMVVQIALLAWLFLDETPDAVQIVGIVAVALGVVLARRR